MARQSTGQSFLHRIRSANKSSAAARFTEKGQYVASDLEISDPT
jgi:hypothetical protein